MQTTPIVVDLIEADEYLPERGMMILANTGAEWHILMYEEDNYGYEWEDDEPVYFEQWVSLSDLSRPTLAAPDALSTPDHIHSFFPDKRGVMRCVVCSVRR